MKKTAMTVEERESFLALAWVAVISIPEQGRGPLTVPVWYSYQPGSDVCVWTGSKTRKGQLLLAAERASLCVQDPKPPYRYVSIEGPVKIEPVHFERDIRPMALRYFGPEMAEQYLSSLGGQAGVAEDILVHIQPENWHTVDYSKLELGH
jgi:hypothetical protein